MVGTDGATPPIRIVLIGMMGSGKSSVGHALAARTGWPFVDNDALVEGVTGLSAREHLESMGETELRRVEADALSAALAHPPPVIVSAAGGTILDAGHRSALADAGFVVWLRGPAGVLAARAAGAGHRPWLDGDAQAWFDTALAAREPLYAGVADLVLDIEALDPFDAAARIVEEVGHRQGSTKPRHDSR
ncbi:MAG TPA: shikimate kinase [Candidatus Limnocylindria bacterium]